MSVTYAAGFQAGTAKAHRPGGSERKNLTMIVNQGPMDTAVGVFTPNRFRAAPVIWTERILTDGHAGAVVINSGNANACTGQEGLEQTRNTAIKAAGLLGLEPEQVAICSTGIIGHLLHLDAILSGVDQAHADLAGDDHAGADAAKAIMTTDTTSKTVTLDGAGYRLAAWSRGRG